MMLQAVYRLQFSYEEYLQLLQFYMDRTSPSINEVDAGGTEDPNPTDLTTWKPQMSVEQVACEWMRSTESTWENWKPKDGNGKIPLFIGGIFPISGSYTAGGILVGGSSMFLMIQLEIRIMESGKRSEIRVLMA
jgi:hypothetical protein